MDQIQTIIDLLGRVLLNKDNPTYDISKMDTLSQEDELYLQLDTLLKDGKINEAENLLFDTLDGHNMKELSIALDFYNKLNRFEEDYLRANNFSHDEIEEGLHDIMQLYGINMDIPM